MTRKTLGLTGTRKKAPKPVATETEVMVEVESDADPRKRFLNGMAINPTPGIRLESGSEKLTVRAMDLITPIGMGQRGLIVAPPGSGKSTILKHICQAVGEAYPKYLDKIRALRRALSGLKPLEGTRKLVELLEKYPTNAELLNSIPGTHTD